ncbi:MAG TPA: hypothetical protein VFU53_13150, partial [Burkholderiales bacterium]|nr:hypothetical protein [Burkholderiales bacterium]
VSLLSPSLRICHGSCCFVARERLIGIAARLRGRGIRWHKRHPLASKNVTTGGQLRALAGTPEGLGVKLRSALLTQSKARFPAGANLAAERRRRLSLNS